MAELYINVIEARNVVGVESNGNSDPYFTISVPNEKGKSTTVFKSKAMMDTRNPKVHTSSDINTPSFRWAGEALTIIEDLSVGSIVIEVKDFNKILSGVSLGVAEIPLMEHQEALLRGGYFELPLRKKGVPNGGTLIVVAGITPSSGLSSSIKFGSTHEYPLARIVMAEDRVLPNFLIKGFVVIRLTKPMKINAFNFSLERTLGFEFRSKLISEGRPKMAAFQWPNPVWRVHHSVELNPSESKEGTTPQAFNLEMGTHLFAFELPAPKREISYFESPGITNRAVLRAEIIDSSHKLHLAEKGIIFSQNPLFMAPHHDPSEILKLPRLPPTKPELIPVYASQFIPGYSGDPIPLEMLYGGDISLAFPRNLVENIKVEWPAEYFNAYRTSMWETRHHEQEMIIVVSNEAVDGPTITKLTISGHRQIIAFREIPGRTDQRSTLCFCFAQRRGMRIHPIPSRPIPPTTTGEPSAEKFKFTLDGIMSTYENLHYSAAMENCGEALSIFWWIQLEAVFSNDPEKIVPLSKFPIFWNASRAASRQFSSNDETFDVDCDPTTFAFAKIEDPKLFTHLIPSGIFGKDGANDATLGTKVNDANQLCRSTLTHADFSHQIRLRSKKGVDHKPIPHVPYTVSKPEDIEVYFVEQP